MDQVPLQPYFHLLKRASGKRLFLYFFNINSFYLEEYDFQAKIILI